MHIGRGAADSQARQAGNGRLRQFTGSSSASSASFSPVDFRLAWAGAVRLLGWGQQYCNYIRLLGSITASHSFCSGII